MTIAVSSVMTAMTRTSTVTDGATGSPGCVYRADAPSTNATRPPTVSSPWLVTVSSSDEEQDRQADEEQAGHVERQAAEPDEGEDQRERAEDAGHPVGVLELEVEPVEPERQEDEGDVRVGQQVQEPLERVHRDLDERGFGRRERHAPATGLDGHPVGLGEQVRRSSPP